MRNTIIGAAIVAVTFVMVPTAAQAREYPWCADTGGGKEGEIVNCGFDTFAQCMATVSGTGGYCKNNPWHTNPPPIRSNKPSR